MNEYPKSWVQLKQQKNDFIRPLSVASNSLQTHIKPSPGFDCNTLIDPYIYQRNDRSAIQNLI